MNDSEKQHNDIPVIINNNNSLTQTIISEQRQGISTLSAISEKKRYAFYYCLSTTLIYEIVLKQEATLILLSFSPILLMRSNVDVVSSITSLMGINMGNKIIHLALALIFLISFTSIANAGKETMIVGSRLTLSPSIYDDIVAWGETGMGGVAIYNMTTGNMTGLGSGIDSPFIYKDKVAWLNGDKSIIVYNVSTGKETKITDELITEMSYPHIYENNMVCLKLDSQLLSKDIPIVTILNNATFCV